MVAKRNALVTKNTLRHQEVVVEEKVVEEVYETALPETQLTPEFEEQVMIEIHDEVLAELEKTKEK